ncbi:MAG: hypothetical protein JRI80_07120, partial [Deltaproteobacteria bacterium]|nr:hypothetical protein [Deltaproteobacteria bacterium]
MNFDLDEKGSALVTRLKEAIGQDAEKRMKDLRTGDTMECLNLFMDYLSRLADIGYLGLGVQDVKNSTALVAAQEALATISPSLFLAVESSARVFGRLIAFYGKTEQKEEILPLLEQGRYVGCVALTEGGMSVENEPFKTTAIPSGDHWSVTGSKDHVINAPMADQIAVIAQSGEELAVAL